MALWLLQEGFGSDEERNWLVTQGGYEHHWGISGYVNGDLGFDELCSAVNEQFMGSSRWHTELLLTCWLSHLSWSCRLLWLYSATRELTIATVWSEIGSCTLKMDPACSFETVLLNYRTTFFSGHPGLRCRQCWGFLGYSQFLQENAEKLWNWPRSCPSTSFLILYSANVPFDAA
jgi:hypothetical protein